MSIQIIPLIISIAAMCWTIAMAAISTWKFVQTIKLHKRVQKEAIASINRMAEREREFFALWNQN